MRQVNKFSSPIPATAALLAVAVSIPLNGCTAEIPSRNDDQTTTWPSNTDTDPDSTTDPWTSTDSTTTTIPPCGIEPYPDNTNEECAVFARADADPALADGTRQHPYASLQAAADAAAAAEKRVLACDVAPFKESVTLAMPVEIWGGIDCENEWAHSWMARTPLEPEPDLIALTILQSAGGSLIVNFAITVPDAVTPGNSAVAVVFDKVIEETSLWASDIVVGNGANGAHGDPPGLPAANGADAAVAGQDGAASNACAVAPMVTGGEAGTSDCDGDPTLGGKGGMGGMPPSASGQSGADGYPAGLLNAGMGQTAGASCTNGSPGAPGMAGMPGLGAYNKGTLSIKGITSVAGQPGMPGTRGQGGGGGGGARAGAYCQVGMSIVAGAGASGGGGGSGGCGGKPGSPGQGGGSSIGLIVLAGEHVDVDAVTLILGNGGDGGDGALGQAGGLGGNGASGGAASGIGASAPGCSGANGGDGGRAGPGGGGRGGHSLGIAYLDKFNYQGLPVMVGKAGKGGLGGKPGAGDGDPGKQDYFSQINGF